MSETEQNSISSVDFTKLSEAIKKLNSGSQLIVFFILVVFLGVVIALIGTVQCNMPDGYKPISYILLLITTFIMLYIWVTKIIKYLESQEIRHYEDKEKIREYSSQEKVLKHQREMEKISSNRDIELEKIKNTSEKVMKTVDNAVSGSDLKGDDNENKNK